MALPHVQHLIHFNFFELPEEVRHFYMFSLIFTVLVTSGSLFLPIYIYSYTGSLFLVAAFVLLSHSIFRMFARTITLPVLRKLGIEYAMFFSILSLSVAFTIVHFVGIDSTSIILVALFEALGFAFYWDSFHTSFGLFGKLREEGEEMSWFYVFQNTLNILVPLISATVIATFGFNTFYTAVVVLAVISSLVLLKLIKTTYRIDFGLREVLSSPLRLFHAVEGMGSGILSLTPLYLYMVLGGVIMLFGWVKTAISLASMVVARLVGRYFDREMPLWMGRIMYLANSFYGLVASMLPNPVAVSLAETVKNIGYTFHIPLAGTIYLIAKRGYPAVTIARSFFISLGKAVGLIVLMALALAIENDVASLGLAILLSAGFNLLAAYLYKDVEKLAKALQK